ncbi:EamA family transporter [Geobacter sp. DSM 9736]|uniref:EamA family transporter n=1 Tax=Geobacter sp. DSM 9736 TaxID=1277350 RepID=UPI000B6065C8|nr:EamA family transporter [Geobacter sp. DSM 9736]SNB46969.1 EamA-like transporter family protein [Geobacter sp. DSM 9736]
MIDLWLPLTLVSAVTLAASDALTKKALSRHNEYLVMWLRVALSLPFLLAVLPLESSPSPAPGFYRAFLTSLFLEIGATFLYMKALKLSPLSLTLPFLSFTPVFLLVIPFLLLGESIGAGGAAGIILIAAGSYVLNLGESRGGWLAPLRAIGKERGALAMLVVSFIYSFTSTLGKEAVVASSPLFFAAAYYAAFVAVTAPVALAMGRKELRWPEVTSLIRAVTLPGILNGVMVATHMAAINMTNVAYMISVKRCSLLFGVLFGHMLFGEKGLRERLAGAALMVAGAALIVLWQ